MDRNDERDPFAKFYLVGSQTEQVIEVERDDHCGAVGDEPGGGEDIKERARDFVQCARVTMRAVLRHELDQSAAKTEIQDRELNRDRAEQDPETVCRGAEVIEIERKHYHPGDGLGEYREVASGDVPGDGDDLSFLSGSPAPLRLDVHAAPLPNSTTFTVSNTIVRSKNTERCLM